MNVARNEWDGTRDARARGRCAVVFRGQRIVFLKKFENRVCGAEWTYLVARACHESPVGNQAGDECGFPSDSVEVAF